MYVQRVICAVFLLFSFLASSSLALQQDVNPGDPTGAAQRGPAVVAEPPQPPAPSSERQREIYKERYAKLKQETDQLVKLANELKSSVDKANQNTLSLDVIKKAEQIEKLARSVREKMRSY